MSPPADGDTLASSELALLMERRIALARRLSRRAGVFVAAVATAVLIGWFTHVRLLESLHSSFVAMTANTAVGLLAAALALSLGGREGAPRRWRAAFAIVAAAIGGLTSFEILTRIDLGIDRLLPYDPTAGAAAPGRMSAVSALGLTLSAAALLAASGRGRRGALAAQGLGLTVVVVFLFAVLVYLYGVHKFAIPGYSTVALHTALAMLVLAGGTMLERPDVGLVELLMSETHAGRALRRLLPAVVVAPIVLGWIRLQGERHGLYNTEFGLAIYATSNIVCLGGVSWWMASSLARLDDLRRVNQTLEHQRVQALEVSRLKSQFLSNMSHELRTPLNAIIGFSELVHRGSAGPVTADQREYLGEVLTSSRLLLVLIEDVLDLTRLEAGPAELKLEAVDLAALAGEVREGLLPIAVARGLGLDVLVDPALGAVEVDRQMVQRIAFNLVSNALKFTSRGGRVRVRIAPLDGDRFGIEVADTGIGIEPENLRRLFADFEPLDSSASKRHQGTGIGLALTKRFVEAHQGTVSVTSQPGLGTTFSVVLPRRPKTA
ncbi:MAG TPA: HAMP domain-containing sensor histidine kinase [Polyangia bacterium]|nr:HAMP domain-containing sensor histidine kinase [Polyangia bacterium]